MAKAAHNPNMNRIQRARKAVRGYAGEFHDLEANIKDILCDLRHLCEAKGIDFDKCDRMARDHYQVESSRGPRLGSEAK
jgi:hypothetical protein